MKSTLEFIEDKVKTHTAIVIACIDMGRSDMQLSDLMVQRHSPKLRYYESMLSNLKSTLLTK